ncbi:hypothetical protein KSF73_09550 [Burkholderiaceae bacterium DAT-1]|nr:hypothetical protein [Burkholderiaceae bacterium DAT-1]
MDSVKEVVGICLSIGFIVMLLLVLGVIVRFSIISPLLTRGERSRLRIPDAEAVAKVVGLLPSEGLVNFYKVWPHLQKSEFYLLDPKSRQKWFFGAFIPLAGIDVEECIKLSGKHGIPIADDLNKGMYFEQPDGGIILVSPQFEDGSARVANSIHELQNFKYSVR